MDTKRIVRRTGTRWIAGLAAAASLVTAGRAQAFCGFYVAKADTKLFNQASQVALVRDGDRTVLSMSNDFEGDPKEFAIVIPVPTILQRGQIHVADRALIDHLDAYSAPRLVEYTDPDPCAPAVRYMFLRKGAAAGGVARMDRERRLGVRIEATYTVGEYDIVILSARQSDGLATWLTENGYRIPPGAATVLGSYLKQGMHFFVAAHFPEDLVFQETADRENFQGRYVLRHPWKGDATCSAAADYRRQLRQRRDKEAQTLASLTGWDADRIRAKMRLKAANPQAADDGSWWKALWKD